MTLEVDVLSAGSSVANYLISQITSGLANELGSADSFLALHLFDTLNSISDASLTNSWFLSSFTGIVSASGIVALIAILTTSISSVLSGGSTSLLRSSFISLPLVGIGSSVVVPLLVLGMRAADALSADFYFSFARSVPAPSTISRIFDVVTSKAEPPLLLILIDVAYLILGLILELEFALRAAAIYICVAIIPFALALYLAPRTRSILIRLIELCAALISSKVIIALGLGISSGLVASENGSLFSAVTATAVLLLCVLSPFALVRLLSGLDSGMLPGAESVSARMVLQTTRMAGNFLTQFRSFGSSQEFSELGSFLELDRFQSPYTQDSTES